MRCTQFIGLNTWAQELLNQNHLKVPTGDKWNGMYSDDGDLYKYTLLDTRFPSDYGKEITEYVQAAPWSSGPCIFLALKDKAGNPIPESLWGEDEINEV